MPWECFAATMTSVNKQPTATPKCNSKLFRMESAAMDAACSCSNFFFARIHTLNRVLYARKSNVTFRDVSQVSSGSKLYAGRFDWKIRGCMYALAPSIDCAFHFIQHLCFSSLSSSASFTSRVLCWCCSSLHAIGFVIKPRISSSRFEFATFKLIYA